MPAEGADTTRDGVWVWNMHELVVVLRWICHFFLLLQHTEPSQACDILSFRDGTWTHLKSAETISTANFSEEAFALGARGFSRPVCIWRGGAVVGATASFWGRWHISLTIGANAAGRAWEAVRRSPATWRHVSPVAGKECISPEREDSFQM